MLTLPTMTEHGLVTDKNIQMVNLFRYFCGTQRSQSTIYSESIVSYDYLLKQYGTESDILIDKMTAALTAMYKRYYVDVEINITIVEDTLNIDIGATDSDGKTYRLSDTASKDIINELDDIVNLYN